MKTHAIILILLFFSICVQGSEIVKVQLFDGESITGKLDLPADSCDIPYLPSNEVLDIESIISTLRKDKRFEQSKIALLGASEGTIIASMVAERKLERVDLQQMIEAGSDNWIWNNYFRITSAWLKEHYQLEANKTRLLRVDIPIYIFHGVEDANVHIEGMYDIQSRFTEAHKTNLQCFSFEEHNRDLNYLDWPYKQEISKGLNAIFEASELLKTPTH